MFRDDLLRVNGFNNAMAYGGLDAELGDRLDNLGLRNRRVRFRAMTVHLWHARPWREAQVVRLNAELRHRIRRQRIVRTTTGIVELAAAAPTDPARSHAHDLRAAVAPASGSSSYLSR